MNLTQTDKRPKERSQKVLAFLGILWWILAAAIILIEVRRPPAITIVWSTETEFNTAGFNVYRSNAADGPFIQINEQLIPSKADPSSGAAYEFIDRSVTGGQTYYYRLEDVEYNNTREQHEIFSGQSKAVDVPVVALAIASFVVGIILIGTGLKAEKRDESQQ